VKEYTKFCVSKLRKCLRSACSDFDWPDGEEKIEGKEFRTWIDVSGKKNNRAVLIQFEMHRESGVCTNALKIAYCLENDRHFRERQILILHVLSPFCEEPNEAHNGPEQISVPGWVADADRDKYPGFVKEQIKKERRESSRKSATKYKLLLSFLKRKGVLDSATTTYEIIEWDLDDFPEVREATIVLPKKELFPVSTPQAVAILARQLAKAIDEWQNGLAKS
jgi:hypothetical protein